MSRSSEGGVVSHAASSRSHWKDGSSCARCSSAFTAVLRKHHCRFCGDPLCYKCAGHFIELSTSKGKTVPFRACDACLHGYEDGCVDVRLTLGSTQRALPEDDPRVAEFRKNKPKGWGWGKAATVYECRVYVRAADGWDGQGRALQAFLTSVTFDLKPGLRTPREKHRFGAPYELPFLADAKGECKMTLLFKDSAQVHRHKVPLKPDAEERTEATHSWKVCVDPTYQLDGDDVPRSPGARGLLTNVVGMLPIGRGSSSSEPADDPNQLDGWLEDHTRSGVLRRRPPGLPDGWQDGESQEEEEEEEETPDQRARNFAAAATGQPLSPPPRRREPEPEPEQAATGHFTKAMYFRVEVRSQLDAACEPSAGGSAGGLQWLEKGAVVEVLETKWVGEEESPRQRVRTVHGWTTAVHGPTKYLRRDRKATGPCAAPETSDTDDEELLNTSVPAAPPPEERRRDIEERTAEARRRREEQRAKLEAEEEEKARVRALEEEAWAKRRAEQEREQLRLEKEKAERLEREAKERAAQKEEAARRRAEEQRLLRAKEEKAEEEQQRLDAERLREEKEQAAVLKREMARLRRERESKGGTLLVSVGHLSLVDVDITACVPLLKLNCDHVEMEAQVGEGQHRVIRPPEHVPFGMPGGTNFVFAVQPSCKNFMLDLWDKSMLNERFSTVLGSKQVPLHRVRCADSVWPDHYQASALGGTELKQDSGTWSALTEEFELKDAKSGKTKGNICLTLRWAPWPDDGSPEDEQVKVEFKEAGPLGLDFAPFPFVRSLRTGSEAEMLALQTPALRPGLCITHIGDDPIAGISQDSCKKLMQNQQSLGHLTISFRAVPSPWATDRPNDTVAGAHTASQSTYPVEPEPDPEPELERHDIGALHVDESIPVGVEATTTDML